jgi:hypothetical protein
MDKWINVILMFHTGNAVRDYFVRRITLLIFFIMISFFDNWSAHDIIGPLNKREVCAALLDFEIERKYFRTWDTIEEMVVNSTDEVKY